MKINIKTTNLELGEVLEKKVKSDINSLEKFARKILGRQYWNKVKNKGRAPLEAFLEVAKITEHHKKGSIFYAECQLRFPGNSLRVTTQRESLDLALKEMKEILKREIQEFKGKLTAKYKRGARKVKKKLLISELAQRKEGKRVLEEKI